MKKILFLSLLFGAVMSINVNAQQDPAAVLEQMKAAQRPKLVEKTGITAAQADKVIELNFEMRMTAATALKGLNDAERSAKIAELKAAKEKKIAEVLTPAQVKAVNDYYESLARN